MMMSLVQLFIRRIRVYSEFFPLEHFCGKIKVETSCVAAKAMSSRFGGENIHFNVSLLLQDTSDAS